ncbi:MAG: hypothetical protein ACQEXJ_12405 [Myxococcota bacterium]
MITWRPWSAAVAIAAAWVLLACSNPADPGDGARAQTREGAQGVDPSSREATAPEGASPSEYRVAPGRSPGEAATERGAEPTDRQVAPPEAPAGRAPVTDLEGAPVVRGVDPDEAEEAARPRGHPPYYLATQRTGDPRFQPAVRPPTGPGEVTSRVEGCATSPDMGVEAKARHPTEERRLLDPRPVRLTAYGTGAVVTHAVDHACCLEADTRARVAESGVTVYESFHGTPCAGCRCRSTIHTAVGLGRGVWAVDVFVSEPGRPPRLVLVDQVYVP